MSSDFHKEAFDEQTKLKLQLYRLYIREWLPVFMAQAEQGLDRINIFDLFCGPGSDGDGTWGSPLILLEAISIYLRKRQTAHTAPIYIYFNDSKKWKIDALKESVATTFGELPRISISYSCSEYDDAFPKAMTIAEQNNSANFLFVDQFGISALDEMRFKELTSLKRTDWLCFISSSTFSRFNNHPSIACKLAVEKTGKWSNIHRDVACRYRELLNSSDYYIVPFSIKKGSNVYGLIFGSGHPLGADKFLRGCWKVDPITGEANYNIDGDLKSPHGHLSFFKPTKLTVFKEKLCKKITEKEVVTNKDAYLFALHQGIPSAELKKILYELKKEKVVTQVPGVSYSTIFGKGKNKIVPLLVV
ncbi:three-Cys-motif partner protein TcmP [Pseudodesulfovibrio sp. zrk46]|uniref:three-Cys-motif partner protein TcmP n=1 Tax=Pseudodesulfovibrio sp. zrk46 TaxID=2725288 RepID=UPI00144A15EF|nr:three-Cys-motif partner protein TcmP [Pseudodesulfovibrio sp. zrk46]QJB55909.1 three-Cys-motif partner protein TcmP [Pseudodesulfovibrio sp. zrk46]